MSAVFPRLWNLCEDSGMISFKILAPALNLPQDAG